jgi:hypothetical protein
MLALARPLRLLAFLLLCALPAGSALRAQVEASLVALAPGEADSGPGELVVGLRLVHQPHWHTYWLQPGTGYPTSIEWQLPPGWTAGPIRWPAPHRVYDSAKNLAGNGYEKVVTLPVTLVPPAGYDPAAALIKRVVAGPGDRVEVRGGQLLRNGEAVEPDWSGQSMDYHFGPVVVPPGHLLVLGDNRNASLDSHVWGPLPRREVIGTAIWRYWPLQRFGPIRFSPTAAAGEA